MAPPKKYSMSQVTREMQIKTTLRYHPVRMATINKYGSVGEGVERKESLSNGLYMLGAESGPFGRCGLVVVGVALWLWALIIVLAAWEPVFR